MKKWIWILAIVLLVGFFFIPIPQKITRNSDGFVLPKDPDSEPTTCRITIDGIKYHYVLKPDVFAGKFEISTDDRTKDALHFDTLLQKGYISHMTYLTDEGYIIPGYFVSSNNLSWLYMQHRAENGDVSEIMAPANNELEADEIREHAMERQSPLPQIE